MAKDENRGSGPVAERHQVDVATLERYLRQHVDGFAGPLTLEQFQGGQSNPTYKLVTPARRYVMRAKPGPAAKLLPSAHAIEREFRVQRALAGSDVPVADMLCLCEDESVIGRAFYVMEMIEGRVFWQQSLPDASPSERGAIYDEMNRVIAALHRVDYDAVGLEGYGRVGHYLERQISRWSKQYLASETEPIPEMNRLIDWLPAHIPAGDETSIVHGDYRIDNTILDAQDPTKVLAVLDWELSTLGDPLSDAALMCVYRDPMFNLILSMEAAWSSPQMPSADELANRYSLQSGQDLAHWDFYMALAYFKAAIIAAGIDFRARQGSEAPGSSSVGAAVAPAIASGLSALG